MADPQIPRQFMSQAEYARHRGVTRQTVNEYVALEKIKLYVDPADGKRKVDVAEADVFLGANVARLNGTGDDDADDSAPPPGGEEKGTAGAGTPGLTAARTASEIYRARTLQVEYDILVGNLRKTDDVAAAARQCAEVLHREIMQLPMRTEDLASAFTSGGVNGLRLALKSVATQICEQIAVNVVKLEELRRDDDADAA